MHITKIELENIKCHSESTFSFSRGTTAITGENGAGKTTLIEAVAWTLFDLLDYKKDDFVRRGTKKGIARVSFESGLDEREYIVYRDTGTGYYVYDPGLKLRIADKKEEVSRFLWQHLGVEAGTDLESLFRRAIGVPQGTFTAIFLESTTERKKAFDKLLKVEEYRRGAEELLKTQRFVEMQITATREKIARAEGELDRAGSVEADHLNLKVEAANLEAELKLAEGLAVEKSESVQTFDKLEKAVSETKSALDAANSESARAEIIQRQKEAEFLESKEAAAKIEGVRADSKQHEQALAKLKEMEGGRIERDKLRAELARCETAESTINADEKHLRQSLASIQKAGEEIELLRPRIAEQEKLERRIEELRDIVAKVKASESTIADLDVRLEKLRETYSKNTKSLAEAEENAKIAAKAAELEMRENEIMGELAHLRASLERDEKFQAEIKNGLCPILSQKCLNLKEGETLEGFVTSQFSELRAKIKNLQSEQMAVSADLRISREAEKSAARVSGFEERLIEIGAEGKRIRAEKDAAETEAAKRPELENEMKTADGNLRELNNPRTRIEILEIERAREDELRESIKKLENERTRIVNNQLEINENLAQFHDFDNRWLEMTNLRDATAAAHKIFLTFAEAAKSLETRSLAFAASKQEKKTIWKRLANCEREFNKATRNYDREKHLAEKAGLLELQKRQVEINARFQGAMRRLAELAEEIKRLTEIKNTLQNEFREKERLEKIAETTVFIRDTLKDAAPLVARNYVYFVSLEANQLFREISGNAEMTLKWAEDYGIILEENGYDRPFISLSGGEQMAAALSVRLALLKQLSDIRIAFFDEPATNMDGARRENLAMQIGQIKHFDQLFVISHDDTFEGYMDHEIRVGD